MGKLTNTLIAANVIVFLLVFSMPEKLMDSVFTTFYFSSATVLQFWRIFTSLFLHASASHLFFNMLALYFFGKVLEDEISPRRFALVYFASGLIGNIAFSLTSADPVVGASGAIFGLMGAAMLLSPAKMIHLYVFPLPLGLVAIIFVIFETLVAQFQPADFTGIATIAHLAGIAFGALFALFTEPKKAGKGLLALALIFLLLIFLGPVFSIIASIGSAVLQIIEAVVGSVLYGIARLLSFLWV